MKLVLIEWNDSSSSANTKWRPLDEIRDEGGAVKCRSVGWLLIDNKKHKVIVPHLSGNESDGIRPYGQGDIAIPNHAILKMKVLMKQ